MRKVHHADRVFPLAAQQSLVLIFYISFLSIGWASAAPPMFPPFSSCRSSRPRLWARVPRRPPDLLQCSYRGLSSVSWRRDVGRDTDAEVGDTGTQQPPQAAASTSSVAVLFGRSSSLLSAPGAESFDNALRVRCAAHCFCFAVAGSRVCSSKLTHQCSWLCRSSRIRGPS
jgi:hypothetical protein